jgi:hypothetical protein
MPFSADLLTLCGRPPGVFGKLWLMLKRREILLGESSCFATTAGDGIVDLYISSVLSLFGTGTTRVGN